MIEEEALAWRVEAVVVDEVHQVVDGGQDALVLEVDGADLAAGGEHPVEEVRVLDDGLREDGEASLPELLILVKLGMKKGLEERGLLRAKSRTDGPQLVEDAPAQVPLAFFRGLQWEALMEEHQIVEGVGQERFGQDALCPYEVVERLAVLGGDERERPFLLRHDVEDALEREVWLARDGLECGGGEVALCDRLLKGPVFLEEDVVGCRDG